MFPGKSFVFFCLATLLAVTGRAQIGPEIARQHAARAGDRLAALQGLRAEGRILIGAETISVVALAQRPGRLRVETTTPLRHVIQVTDGVHPAWISHPDTQGGAPEDMTEVDARDFAVSADFDGVLVDYTAKGYSVDYAGEETWKSL
jgi:outer membrane lipoprotein-sorting protein